jgi:translation initiation factor 2 beta subunit (eIF-2beta)/eIF-5
MVSIRERLEREGKELRERRNSLTKEDIDNALERARRRREEGKLLRIMKAVDLEGCARERKQFMEEVDPHWDEMKHDVRASIAKRQREYLMAKRVERAKELASSPNFKANVEVLNAIRRARLEKSEADLKAAEKSRQEFLNRKVETAHRLEGDAKAVRERRRSLDEQLREQTLKHLDASMSAAEVNREEQMLMKVLQARRMEGVAYIPHLEPWRKYSRNLKREREADERRRMILMERSLKAHLMSEGLHKEQIDMMLADEN